MHELGTGIEQLSQQEREQQKADAYNASAGDLHETDGYNCDRCKNKGYVAIVTQNEMYGYWCESLALCKCQRVRKAIRKLNRSGLQNVVKDYTFEKYSTPEPWQESIKQKAMAFCRDDQHHWFFIGGQSGAGKSHLGTAIAVHYIRQGLDVVYMQWLEDIDRIKAASMEGEQLERLLQEFKTAPVLYIDDLFKAGNGQGTKEGTFSQADVKRTFEILNYRYNNPGLITIISSEKTIPEMVEIDEAFAGRVAERTQSAGYCINLTKDIKKNWRLKNLLTY